MRFENELQPIAVRIFDGDGGPDRKVLQDVMQIVTDRAGDQRYVVADVAEAPAGNGLRQRRQIMLADADEPGRGLHESRQQTCNVVVARSGSADQGDALRDLETKGRRIHSLDAGLVLEGDIGRRHRSAQPRHGSLGRRL